MERRSDRLKASPHLLVLMRRLSAITIHSEAADETATRNALAKTGQRHHSHNLYLNTYAVEPMRRPREKSLRRVIDENS